MQREYEPTKALHKWHMMVASLKVHALAWVLRWG